MTPRPTTTAPAEPHSQPTLTKHELSSNQANYLVRKADMEAFLQETFGPGMDFNVSTKSGRWIYYAERKLTTQEVSKWIAELHKRKKAQLAEARARAGGGTESSSASGCGGTG